MSADRALIRAPPTTTNTFTAKRFTGLFMFRAISAGPPKRQHRNRINRVPHQRAAFKSQPGQKNFGPSCDNRNAQIQGSIAKRSNGFTQNTLVCRSIGLALWAIQRVIFEYGNPRGAF